MSDNQGNVCLPRLTPEIFEKARRATGELDIYYLEGEWRDWIAGCVKPENQDAAFIAFCRKKYQLQGRP